LGLAFLLTAVLSPLIGRGTASASPSPYRSAAAFAAPGAAAPPSPDQLNLTPNYPQESTAALAFDSSDNATVLVTSEGARNSTSGTQAVTWTYANRTLHRLLGAGTPNLSAGYVLSDDPHDGYDLLLGGTAPNGTVVNATWAYHAGVWTQLHPAVSPPANGIAPFMAYDEALSAVVLLEGSSPHRNQTWEYSGGTWTELLAHGPANFPPDRAMAYDPSDGYLLTYGGFPVTNATTGLPAIVNNTTWEFDRGRWVQLSTSGTLPGLTGFQLQFDPALDRLLLFGGNFANGTPDPYAWSYHLQNWTQLPGYYAPGTPGRATVIDDSADQQLLAYDPPGLPIAPHSSASADLWTLNGTNWQPAGNATIFPSPRCCDSLAYDAADGYLLSYGGFTGAGGPSPNLTLNDTWGFTNGSWRNLTPATSPPPSFEGGMAYDTSDGYVVLFGGFAGAARGETWSYRADRWTQTGLAGGPSASSQGCLAYDTVDGYVLYYGGVNGTTASNQTWAFRGGNWRQLTTNGSPPALTGCEMANDRTDGYVVLWGGVVSGHYVNATWSFRGGNWTEEPSGPSPSTRVVPFLAADPAVGGVLLYGGAVGSRAVDSDLWLFSHGGWVPLSQGRTAGIQAGGSAAYDPALGDVVMFTGLSGSDRSQLWIIQGKLPFTAVAPVLTPASVDRGQSFTMASGAYGGSGIYSYRWQGLPTGCRSVNLSEWSCVANLSGSFAINVTVADTVGHTFLSPNVTLTVAPDPALSVLQVRPGAVDVGMPVNLSVNASGGALPYRYQWSGLPMNCSSANRAYLICHPNATGNFTVDLHLTDARGVSASAAANLQVNGPVSLSPVRASVSRLDVGQRLELNASPRGGTGELTFLWSGLPAGCPARNASNLSCYPSAAGAYRIELNATDALGEAAQAVPTTVDVNGSLNATSLTASTTALDIGQSISFAANASGGTDPYHYTWHGLPEGCAGNDSPDLTCLPGAKGRYSVYVNVTDQVGVTTQGTPLVLQVTSDPSISSVALLPPSLDVGQSTTVSVVAYVDNGSETLAWSGLPSGCAPPSDHAASFRCSPGAAGNFSVSVGLTDERNDSVSSGASELVVTGAPSLSGLSAAPAGLDVGQSTNVSVLASAPSGYALTWSGLPYGCTAPASTIRSFTCRPTEPGNYSVSVELVDGHGASLSAGPLAVNVAPGLSVGLPVVSEVTPHVNDSFEIWVPVQGGSGDLAVQWSGLPAGCAPEPTGWNESCTPRATGAYSVRATATDRFGEQSASRPLDFNISANGTHSIPPVPPPAVVHHGGATSQHPLPDVVWAGIGVLALGTVGLVLTLWPRWRTGRSP
jgi:hypothetical protein